ncbi:EAL domain-containing protein, partial [Methylobacterium crusticola]
MLSPLIDNDADRLNVLRALRILDTPPEPHFDAVSRTAQALFGAPVAWISLVDHDRQWFKAKCGVSLQGTSREVAFCSHTIRSDEILVVEDATRDERFRDNPLVTGDTGFRFYAGAPLQLRPGIRVGTLCVLDTKPRAFALEQRRQLQDLAHIVVAHLRLHESKLASEQEVARRRSSEALVQEQARDIQEREAALREANRLLTLAEQVAHLGHWHLDVASRRLAWSDEVFRICGLGPRDEAPALAEAVAAFHPDDRQRVTDVVERSLATGDGFEFPARMVRPDGVVRDVVSRGICTVGAAGAVTAVFGTLMDVTEIRRTERQLREMSSLLETTLESMDQGLVMVDAQGVVRVCNARVVSLLDLPPEMMRAQPLFSAVRRYKLQRGEFTRSQPHVRDQVTWCGIETEPPTYELERPDGTVLEIRTVPLPEGGAVRTYTDITERKRAEMALARSEAALRQSEERLRFALDSGSDGLWDYDILTGEAWISDRWHTMLGYEPGELQVDRHTWVHLVHPEDKTQTLHQMEEHLEGRAPTFEREYRLRRKDGSWGWVLARGKVVARDAAGAPLRMVGTHIDISARKAVESKVTWMAVHDGLTDLPNRNLFRERLNERLLEIRRRGEGCAVLYLDLDRFKAVNDTLGHLAGDALLREIAHRIRSMLRSEDTVARLGGDEFAVLLARAGQHDEVAVVARRLIETVQAPVTLGAQQIEVGVSIGIAFAPPHGNDAETLFKRADLALYRAKAEGRNTFRFFEAAMDEAVEERRRLELDLRLALQRGEFELHYQPILDIASGAITSAEALVRWRHPTRGLVPPGTFIPLAEETGLIVPLGEWVLRAATHDARRWPAHVSVAVNVSALQVRHGHLVRTVRAALEATGLPARRLELEITESALMTDNEHVCEVLHDLRGLGVRIALDDFGTGYSSLSYLRQFPFDKLKIDRSFISGIRDPETAAIVRAIVALGTSLGMVVTAEGIETPEQFALARAEGCTTAQGYLIGRPCAAGDVLAAVLPGAAARAA